jgi:hypothetical protein
LTAQSQLIPTGKTPGRRTSTVLTQGRIYRTGFAAKQKLLGNAATRREAGSF